MSFACVCSPNEPYRSLYNLQQHIKREARNPRKLPDALHERVPHTEEPPSKKKKVKRAKRPNQKILPDVGPEAAGAEEAMKELMHAGEMGEGAAGEALGADDEAGQVPEDADGADGALATM